MVKIVLNFSNQEDEVKAMGSDLDLFWSQIQYGWEVIFSWPSRK
jgi:hypothetical protein